MIRRALGFAFVSLLALSAAAQSTFVYDTFTTGPNTNLQSHTPDIGGAWTKISGAGNAVVNGASDKLWNSIGGDLVEYRNAATPPSASYNVGVDVSFSNASWQNVAEVFGRATTTLSAGYVARIDAQGTVLLIRYSGGVPTLLGSGYATITSVTQLLLVITDSSKEVWVNGTLITSSADNSVTAAGLAGLGEASNNIGTARLDNFFAGSLSPTAVEMDEMRATRSGGQALIEWTTGREIDNLGYRIWREDARGRSELTGAILAGSAFFTRDGSLGSGNTYRWLDDSTTPRAVYWIEEIDLGGEHTWHGPIEPERGAVDARSARSPYLNEVAQKSGVGITRERVVASEAEVESAATSDARSMQFALAAAGALKIAVTERGWYELSQPQLVAAGLSSRVDPRKLQLYADGIEVPLIVTGENDRRFDGRDVLRFYGVPNDTPSSGERVYWLVAGATAGRRITTATPRAPRRSRDSGYLATAERVEKRIFVPTLTGSSDGFVGPIVSGDPRTPTMQMLHIGAIDTGAPTTRLEVSLQGGTGGGAHRVAVTLNGHDAGEVAFAGQDVGQGAFEVPSSWLVDGDNTVSCLALNGAEDISAVLATRLTWSHTFTASAEELLFTAGGNLRVELDGFTSSSVEAFDVTDPMKPSALRVSASRGVVTVFTAGAGQRIVTAFGGGRYRTPARIERDLPSSVNAARGADLLIIAGEGLADAIAPLADLRRSQGISTLVVRTSDVYDEFSFGSKDPAAIRDLIAAARQWRSRVRYVLLAGDATFDPRDYVGGGAADLVPTKLVATALQLTSSDSWFADLDGDDAADVPIGRLPARTAADLSAMVAKLVAYDAAPPGQWASQAVMVSGSDPTIPFRTLSDASARQLHGFDVADVDVAGAGIPAARATLLQAWNAGASVVNFIGHGSVEIWQSSRLFGSQDAQHLTNQERLPAVAAMSCLNAYFHDVWQESLAEALLRNSGGGAVSVWALSSMTEAAIQSDADAALLSQLADGETFGDATLAAQRATPNADVRRTLILLGDPSMRLKR